jgi:tetratricopeptide (TPR) repeat protein
MEPPPKTKLDRMTRLNLLLGLLLVVLVGAPYAVPWVMERLGWRAPEPVVAPSAPVPLADRAPSAATEPAIEPSADGPTAALAREALALYQQGKVAEACERYGDLVGRLGTDVARRNFGTCLARLGREADEAGQLAAALDHYERAVREYPQAAVIWRGLARIHAKQGNLAQAETVLGRALQSHPADPELLYLLAEAQERQGRTADATASLRTLLAAHPDHARARTLLAGLERDQKVEAGYWSQESRHFVARYEGAAGLDAGRSVVDTLEEAYESIGRDLGVLPGDRIQVGLYTGEVFGDVTGAPPHLIAGIYDRRRIRLNLSAARAGSRQLGELVRHEYAHVVIHQASQGRAPVWVHEGLAQVLEPRTAPRALRVRLPRERLTLDGIEQLSRSGNPQAMVAGYALTHVAVESLVERGGLGGMRDFLGRLGRGEPIEQALRGTFGISPEELEARLQAVAERS